MPLMYFEVSFFVFSAHFLGTFLCISARNIHFCSSFDPDELTVRKSETHFAPYNSIFCTDDISA